MYSKQIPTFIDYFEENSELYLVQEWIDGITLHQEFTTRGKFTQIQTIQLLIDILIPLVFCHQEQLIHRDLKPENIMRRRENGQLVIIDFGVAKDMDKSSGNSLSYAGTPGYAAMEQTRGKPLPASDIYAVGIIGIEALTGMQPDKFEYNEGTLEIAWRQHTNATDAFADVLSRMVRQIPNNRYSDAKAALEALSTLQQPTRINQQQTQQPTILVTNKPPQPTKKITPHSAPASNIFQQVVSIEPTANPPIKQSPPIDPHLTYVFETVTLDKTGQIIKKSPGKAKYLPVDLGEGIILEMVYIPPGKFWMGSPEGEGDKDEKPQHLVNVSAFYLGKYPITQSQYQAIMGKNPSDKKSDNHPVTRVYWNDAKEFCERLSMATNRVYRLPSESEWEYACRAGTTTPFYFGETITSDVANYYGTSTYANELKGKNRGGTTEVGKFPPNAFGLYDMHGNLAEWCEDIRHDNYKRAPTDGSAWLIGSLFDRIEVWLNKSDFDKIYRGGAYFDIPEDCRSAARQMPRLPFVGEEKYFGYGFRIVLGFQ
jgi:eukaryotic-like serine/threonine-protein kinase